MTRSRYRVWEQQQPHFLTCTIVAWLPVFTRPDTVQIVFDVWRFLQMEKRLNFFGYVILENHLHWIASAPELSKEFKAFKSFTAHRVLDLLEARGVPVLLDQFGYHKARHKVESRYQLWQEGSHPELIQGEELMRQKLEYIHNNPVKRGYVDEPTHWR